MKEKNEFEKHQAAKKYYDAGQALALRGRYEEALVEYDKAIELKPNDAVAINNRTIVIEKLRSAGDATRD